MGRWAEQGGVTSVEAMGDAARGDAGQGFVLALNIVPAGPAVHAQGRSRNHERKNLRKGPQRMSGFLCRFLGGPCLSRATNLPFTIDAGAEDVLGPARSCFFLYERAPAPRPAKTMTFDDRLRQAIERGQRRGEARALEAQQKAMTEEEFKRLHSQHRLTLSEHIEACLKRLPNFFPGFQYETIFGERGWGGACSRDDLQIQAGARTTNYSRLEMVVGPYSPQYHVLDISAKGAIRNKEVYNRTFYEKLEEADIAKFRDLIDAWALEYAEMYAAAQR